MKPFLVQGGGSGGGSSPPDPTPAPSVGGSTSGAGTDNGSAVVNGLLGAGASVGGIVTGITGSFLV